MIRVENLSIRAGQFHLDQVTLEVPTGSYGALMGRTGSGKTTILECICGLRPALAGRIHLGDRDVTSLRPADRGLAYVPQDGALFTTMSVRDHLAFSLRIRGAPRWHVKRRVAEMARLLGIGNLLDRKPAGLSGGERQRVALGRAMASHPDFLLLDEPLSALDEETRDEMYNLLESIQQKTGVTVLHITHSRADALRLADTVLMLRDGRVQPLDKQQLHDLKGNTPCRAENP